MPPARNYRISSADILNRSCAFHADLESILLEDPSQNPFSTASANNGLWPPRVGQQRIELGLAVDRFYVHFIGTDADQVLPIRILDYTVHNY